MTSPDIDPHQPDVGTSSSVNYAALLAEAQDATPAAPLEDTDQQITPGDTERPGQDLGPEHPVKPKPSLESLRRGLRGSDSAVVEIGADVEQEAFVDVLKDPGHHSREELLDAVLSNYSGEAYGDYQWSKTSGGWSTPEVATMYGELRETHPQFAQLSLDPGFMTHLPEFMEMLSAGKIKSTDYAGARDELKTKLGYRTLYRGTMLTDEELHAVRETGMLSPLSQNAKDSDNPTEQFEATALSAAISDAVERHFHGEHGLTPFLSVSEHPDVAIAVGRHFAKRGEGKNFYLFELSVPVIDVVAYTDHAVKTPYKLQQMKDRNPDISLKVSVNDQQATHPWDEKVESYVFGKINPEEITAISQPEITESTWNGRRTS